MGVTTWTEAKCDQCGKVLKRKGASGYGYYGYRNSSYTPKGWMLVFSRLFCGWKCVAAYATERANEPKVKPKPKATKKRKRRR